MKMIQFNGTNYLGIDRHTDFQELVREGISKYGLHYGGSRLASNCPEVFEEAEQLCCALSGAEAALIVSSGTKAALLATSAIEEGSTVYHVPHTHAALLNGPQKSKPVSRYTPNQNISDKVCFLGNSVDPLHCYPIHFNFVKDLKNNTQLIVDDSHGIGINGKNGFGIFASLRKRSKARITVIASLGKAFGIPGGLILSDHYTIKRIKSLATFGGGAPPPPAYVYAFTKGQTTYTNQREKLQKNIAQFRNAIEQLGLFRFLEKYPVFYSKKDEIAEYLKSNEIAISSFRYPTSKDELITRVVLSARHQPHEIQYLTSLIQTYLRDSN